MRKIQFNQNLPEASKPATFNASEHNPNKLLPQKGIEIPRNLETPSSRSSFSPHLHCLTPAQGKTTLKADCQTDPAHFTGGGLASRHSGDMVRQGSRTGAGRGCC